MSTYRESLAAQPRILDLTKSIIGFMNAATMFSIEQVKTSVCAITDPTQAADRFQRSLDSISHAMTGDLDASGRERVRRMDEAANRGVEALRTVAFSPDELSGRKM